MKKIENFKINISGKEYDVYITRKKIKNTYIRIDDNLKIKVSTNYYTSLSQIKSLLQKNQQKICKTIDLKEERSLPENKIAYLGKIFFVEFAYNNQYKYIIDDEKITFYSPNTINKGLAIERFYQEEANKLLPEFFQYCLLSFQKRFDIKEVTCFIRKMKVRYGTCYYKKNKVILNSYLLKYDKKAIEYVIYHELCHFIYHNHSKKFYELLNSFVVDHADVRQLLNKY